MRLLRRRSLLAPAPSGGRWVGAWRDLVQISVHGLALDRLTATFKLSRSDKAVDKAAKHIHDALRGASNVYPGKGKIIPSILTRTTNAKTKAANTAKARAACKKKWPKKPSGKDCDEYPFKTTREGAAKGDGNSRYATLQAGTIGVPDLGLVSSSHETVS